MPTFVSGHFRVFWHVLFDAAARFEETDEEDREIIIISPWISDVTTSNSGWSETAIVSAFDPHGEGNIESLSDVLGRLVKIGYNVKVVTLSTVGKWLPKRIDKNLDKEIKFMEKIDKLGIECFVRNNVHMKVIKTPFSIFSGSVNFSFNGLSGRNQESATYFVKSIHTQDYSQSKQHSGTTVIGAKDYFRDEIPITEWNHPEFKAFPDSVKPNLVGKGASYDNDENPHQLSGYVNLGQIGDDIGENEKLSMIAHVSQLILRMGIWVIRLISDDTLEGRTRDDIEQIILSEIDNTPDDRERLPDLNSMKGLVLPDNHENKNYILTRLGHKDDEEIWTIWSHRVRKVFEGLYDLSDKIHNESVLTKEDAETIERITEIFDSLRTGRQK